ncbi:MAG: hypothetical protein AAF846_11105 [Chloroflexota bacterium]
MIISTRAYIIIAAFTAGLLSLIVYFDTTQATATFFGNLADNARPFLGAGVTNLIYTPLQNVFTDYIWAIAAGIIWPVALIWLFLMLIGIVATIVGPTISEVGNL